MRQVNDFSDSRNKDRCVHCGGPYESDDHNPSKVFLDEPFPENLPVSWSCNPCNNGFSQDEEYLACFIECVVCGTTDPLKLRRQKIADRLVRSSKLATLIEQSRRAENNRIIWDVDLNRVRTVILKLSRGHASFELAEPRIGQPSSFLCKPLEYLSKPERIRFSEEPTGDNHSGIQLTAWPEVGSRAMSRIGVLCSWDEADFLDEGWLVVQEGRYRYRALQENGVTVQIILAEFLACEVVWSD